MTSKKGKSAPTNDELLAQFDDLGVEEVPPPPAKGKPNKQSTARSEQDLLAELNNLAAQRPASRPATPSLKATPATTGNQSPKRTSTATPPPRVSDEGRSVAGARKSGESTRSFHQAFTPATTEDSPEPEAKPASASGGGWWGGSSWGGLLATATKAAGQAQAALKEIQKNEEAHKWTEQIRGNVGALRGIGGNLQNLGLNTFTEILHIVAPPISQHEQLQIHITHDLTNYPSLDPQIYAVFSRVMSQVEGGSLMVIQRGQESSPRREDGRPSNTAGWSDGPWWRATSGGKRSINAVHGLVPGTKLARASAESYATEFFAPKGGIEAAAKIATESLSETNPTRSSDIFLSIQAIREKETLGQSDLFAPSSTEKSQDSESPIQEPTSTPPEQIIFAIYLHDPIHSIAYSTVSQPIPASWVDWLDATYDPNSPDPESSSELPQSIISLISSGGVDPREWIAEWVDEILQLGIGVVAQRYVAKRMGVGESSGVGAAKGKMKAGMDGGEVVGAGAGEMARAVAGL
ncbi:hypothetical protein UCRPC4_g00267 [Phaeomoniella chlamydospora]|uniref:Maintenance of telomere capping protein 1 n=1 Tax=Phaeomoniella chlamydospora TaxID=158046 RepID=A0A0G2H167_PHACM|nr:hypothetical protein UCRPC4_g00267 [Phaeomoniella chlamydospora]